MTTAIKIYGIPEALYAFEELPRRLRFKHLRIALNAGGGVIRDRAAAIVRRESGLLSKSLGVVVKIPDASFNEAHHGKPAYAVIGPKRKSGRFMRINKQGNLKGLGKAQRELVRRRKELGGFGIHPLAREKIAVDMTKKLFPEAIYRNPSRYAHLVEKGHRKGKGRAAAPPYPFLSRAVSEVGNQALAKIEQKLRDGLNAEAVKLGQFRHSVALGVG